MTGNVGKVARSLLQLTQSQSKKVTSICLRASEDLKCVNLFCEKVGGPCICRLERAISNDRLLQSVQVLDLSENCLTHLPPSLARFKNLQELDLNNNMFSCFETELFAGLKNLKELKISVNPLSDPTATVQSLRNILPHTKISY